jgi:AcrR family transcriptional regulator
MSGTMARDYRLDVRARRQEETRLRIVEAAIDLHQTIGPAATTMTEIADRAGVGRVTVYRHFADEDVLAGACSALYFERHPAPDPERWTAIADPLDRLRAALGEVYAHHRATEAMMTRVLADARDHEVVAPYHAHWAHAADMLTAPWRARGRRRMLLRAAIGHALAFDTWRSLVRDEGLGDADAVEVAVGLAGAGDGAGAAAVRSRS